MKTIALFAVLILTLGNVSGQNSTPKSKLPMEELKNYSEALQHRSYALLEKLQDESEFILFTHHPAVSLTVTAKEKLVRELSILDAIQQETEAYFFKRCVNYSCCIVQTGGNTQSN